MVPHVGLVDFYLGCNILAICKILFSSVVPVNVVCKKITVRRRVQSGRALSIVAQLIQPLL